MRKRSFREIIGDRLDSGAFILYILTEDDQRAAAYVRKYFEEKDKEVILYDPSSGFSCDEEEQYGEDFVEIVIDWIGTRYLENKQLLLRDFHRELDDIRVISAIKQIIRNCKKTQIIIVSNVLSIPRELEHYTAIIQSPPPDENEIKKILGADLYKNSHILKAAHGLEAVDLEQIVRQIKAETRNEKEQERLFAEKKAEIFNKTGILTVETAIDDDTCLGGYQALKEWLEVQRSVLEQNSALLSKGMLLLGITGCGKSLCAKVTAGKLGQPLVRMEFGKIVNKYVGESERNLYKALQIIEAMSPCVLWLDEFEKAIGGDDDHGVNRRLMGIFLTWMQERKSEIFIVATVNNVSKLPAELLRRGRFDKIYYVDLPNDSERKDIFKIHAEKLGIAGIEEKTLNSISNSLEGYSGADIEYILREAKRVQIHNQKANHADDIVHIVKRCITKTYPISIMLGDEVKKMRDEFMRRRFENVNGSNAGDAFGGYSRKSGLFSKK